MQAAQRHRVGHLRTGKLGADDEAGCHAESKSGDGHDSGVGEAGKDFEEDSVGAAPHQMGRHHASSVLNVHTESDP